LGWVEDATKSKIPETKFPKIRTQTPKAMLGFSSASILFLIFIVKGIFQA